VPELAIKASSTLEQAGNKVEAERVIATWLKDNPKDVVVRQYLAEMASSKGDWAGAAKQYRTMLDIAPNSPRVLNNLAWALGQLKDPKALEFAEKAVSLAPNSPSLMDTLAVLLAEKGDTGRALELLRKAVDLAPGQAEIRLNLARTLIKAGEKGEARKHLDVLAKLGDKYPQQAEVAKLISGL
jgi:Tfp pilus assembly protein PilF